MLPKNAYKKGLARAASFVIALMLLSIGAQTAYAASNSTFSQTINQGTLAVDIVDGSGNSVGSPQVNFNAITFDFADQVASATLGTAGEKVRVSNRTATSAWTLSLAATSGVTAVWSDGATESYDFNDPTASAGDGADVDSVGGELTVDPSGGTLTPVAPYTSTGVTLGSSAAFDQGTTDSITLMSADGTSDAPGRWDLTGVSLSQTLPASQNTGTYTLNFTLTSV